MPESYWFDYFRLANDVTNKVLIYKIYKWQGFPGGLDGKESVCNAGDPGLIRGSGRSPEEGNGYSLQGSGRLQSMGSQRVGQDWVTNTFTFWLSYNSIFLKMSKKIGRRSE